MVLVELGMVPEKVRRGPLIVSPKTGLPYAYERFRDLWRTVSDRAGISREVWNRDLRAAAVTEARQGAAPTDDVAKVTGHANKRTTAQVYDREHLEAHRRVMKARVAHRGKDGE
jgi:integrase